MAKWVKKIQETEEFIKKRREEKEKEKKEKGNKELMSGLINRCWQIVLDQLNDKNVELRIKRYVALEIVKKSVPRNVDANVNMTFEDFLIANLARKKNASLK